MNLKRFGMVAACALYFVAVTSLGEAKDGGRSEHKRPDSCNQEGVPALLDSAKKSMAAEDFKAALVPLSDALNKAGDCYPAKLDRGICYFKLHKTTEAKRDFWHVIDADPNEDRAFFYLGLITLRKGLFDRAIGFFLEANDIQEKPLYMVNAAIAAAKAERWNTAWDLCFRAKKREDCPDEQRGACDSIMAEAKIPITVKRAIEEGKKTPMFFPGQSVPDPNYKPSASATTTAPYVRGHYRVNDAGRRVYVKPPARRFKRTR